MDVPVRFKRLSPLAVIPEYQSEHASGMDLHAAIAEPVTVQSGEIARIPCGFAMSLPPGHEAQVRPRSGLAMKYGITVVNAPGTIDSDFRGECTVGLINLGTGPFEIVPSMRIAQMVVAPVVRCTVEEVDDLDETVRGAGGFGSTGQ